jgi:hypothetical protein
MASREKILEKIQEIGTRPKNVTYEEIDWVVDQLGQFYVVHKRQATHGTLYRVDSQRFMVSGHNPGNKQVKRYCVEEFLGAMIELGLYEEG